VGRDRFDGFAAGYSRTVDEAVAFSGQTQEFFLDAKARQLAELAEEVRADRGAAPALRALEVGCGPGLMRLRLQGRIGRLWGIDTSLGCLAQAGRAGHRGKLVAADGQRVPMADGSFDLVFAVCVLHHVPPGGRDALVGEMARLARPGGLVAIWEHNPWNPLTRRVVARCPFDRDAVLLSLAGTKRLLRRAGLSRIWSRYGLFFPWRGRGWQAAERLLAQVPMGAQYVAFGTRG
jgi:SAM-dependent methyltransferase